MNFRNILSLLIPFMLSCNPGTQKDSGEIIFHQKDKEILEQVFDILRDDKNMPISGLMIKVGAFFMGTPYVASTLEICHDKENLVINLREMDCTTFAENCLAISRTIINGNPNFEKFVGELQNIRYRNGIIDGYLSRLHYFSDWIFDNDLKKITKSISKEPGEIPCQKTINFMSTHPTSYIQLKDNSALIQTIASQEKEISARKTYFIPKEKIGEFEEQLVDGDIVGITTGIKGLDIIHVGILVRKGGRIHLMHASSDAEKVIVSEETLVEYLVNSKNATGVMVARPL